MSPLMAGYTFLTLAMLALCALAALVRPQAREVLAAALFVVFLTYATKTIVLLVNVAGYNLKPPASFIAYPIQDTVCVIMCAWAYMRHHATWKIVLGLGFMIQIFGHVAFWSSRDGSVSALLVYTTINNVLYGYGIVVLLCAGGGHVASWIAALPARGRRHYVRSSLRDGS